MMIHHLLRELWSLQFFSRPAFSNLSPQKDSLIYVRYMDDIQEAKDEQRRGQGQESVLAPSRWKRPKKDKCAMKTVNQILSSPELEKLARKTREAGSANWPDRDQKNAGKIAKGFDFLGYHFTCDGNTGTQLTLAAKTIANFNEKLSRLYEQNRKRMATIDGCRALETKIKTYINRFAGWAYGGFADGSLILDTGFVDFYGSCTAPKLPL